MNAHLRYTTLLGRWSSESVRYDRMTPAWVVAVSRQGWDISGTTLEIRVPTELLEYGLKPDDVQRHVLEWLVISLFKDEHISSGKAARLMGLTRVEFLALLRRRGVAYVDYSPKELNDELAAVQSLAVDPRP